MRQMLDMIHTEDPGPVGFSIAIVFYFACIAVIFFVITYVILPAVRSVSGHAAALALPYFAA